MNTRYLIVIFVMLLLAFMLYRGLSKLTENTATKPARIQVRL